MNNIILLLAATAVVAFMAYEVRHHEHLRGFLEGNIHPVDLAYGVDDKHGQDILENDNTATDIDSFNHVIRHFEAEKISSSTSSNARSPHNYGTARIIGGREAQEDLYSFTVALTDSIGLFCGGSLIARDVILTAAHCQGPPFDVVVGRHHLQDKDGEVISIKQQVPHPKYNERTTDYDFMLVFLSSAVKANVILVKLNDDPTVPAIDDLVTVMGWGDTDISDHVSTTSDVLLKVEVNCISNDDCEDSKYQSDTYQGKISQNMLCAKANGQDSCQGDSGGPLVIQKGGEEVLIGVVSWGIGCASEHFPGVYARVSRAHKWIKEGVCKGSEYAAEAGFDCSGTGEDSPPSRGDDNPPSSGDNDPDHAGVKCVDITNKFACRNQSLCLWHGRCKDRKEMRL